MLRIYRSDTLMPLVTGPKPHEWRFQSIQKVGNHRFITDSTGLDTKSILVSLRDLKVSSVPYEAD